MPDDRTRAEPELTRRVSGRTALGLVGLVLGTVMLASDFTSLNVALPSIEADFDTDVITVQWVINAYALATGMLIVAGGRFADMFGRKRLVLIGAVVFALASIGGGIAGSEAWLIAARVVMGAGGAMMWPAILGLVYAAFPGRAGLAGGIVIGAVGLGQSIGPVSGGALTDLLDWRAIFFVNVPICALVMLTVRRAAIAPQPLKRDERVDYAGIATLSVAVFALLFAMEQATDWGWGDARIVGCLAAAVMLTGVFVAIERRGGVNALIPRDVIRRTRFTAACAASALASATFFSSLLYLPQFMQKLLDFSPLESGVGMLPLVVVFALTAFFVAGPAYDRLGAKPVVCAGAGALVAGPLLLSAVGGDAGYSALVPGMVAIGLGRGLFSPSVTTAAITALDSARSSLASGLLYMFQIAGGAVGLGLATTLFTTSEHNALTTQLANSGLSLSGAELEAVDSVLAGGETARHALASFGPDAGRLLEMVRDAFAAGFSDAFLLNAALAGGALAISLLLIGEWSRRGAGQ